MALEINGIQGLKIFQPQAKPVDERNARPVYGGDNFFVNPRPEVTQYVPQDLFSGNTVGLSGLVANSVDGNVHQNLPAQAGYSAGVSTRSFVA